MTSSRRLGGILLMVSILGLVTTGFSGFGDVTAHRDASVQLTDAEDAYFGIEPKAHELELGIHSDVTLAKLTNRFPGPLTEVTLDLQESDLTSPRFRERTLSISETGLSPGESARVSITIVCGADSTDPETVTVQINARGPEVSIQTSFSVTARCLGPPPDRSNRSRSNSNRG